MLRTAAGAVDEVGRLQERLRHGSRILGAKADVAAALGLADLQLHPPRGKAGRHEDRIVGIFKYAHARLSEQMAGRIGQLRKCVKTQPIGRPTVPEACPLGEVLRGSGTFSDRRQE